MLITAVILLIFAPFISSQPANDYLPLRNTFSSISKTPFYADKTEMLRLFFEDTNRPPDHPFYFVTCPRKFGKTINIDMVKHFAEIKFSEKTHQEAIDDFKHTKIAQYPKIMTEHMNRYPVIHIELSGLGVGGLSPTSLLVEMATRLHDSLNYFTWTDNLEAYYQEHGTTVNEITKMDELAYIEKVKNHNMTDEDMENFLFVVGKMLYDCFNQTQVIVLVDEYDHAALSFLNERSFEQTHMVYQIMNNMFNFAFRCPPERDWFKFALIVGVSSLSYSVEIALRSISHHLPFLEEHPFTPFFGLTDEDVDQIFDNYHCTKEEIAAVKEFYAPYNTKEKRNIFNTFSISEYFKNRKNVDPSLTFTFCTYWKPYEVQRGLVDFFKNPRFRERAARLIDKRKIPMYLYKTYSPRMLDEFLMLRTQGYRQPESDHADMYFTLMYEFGYLSYEDDAESTYCIPNADVQEVWEELYHMYSERQQG